MAIDDDDGVQFLSTGSEIVDVVDDVTTTTTSSSSSLGDCVISVSDCDSKLASIISFRILLISVGLISGGCEVTPDSTVEYDGLRVGGGGRDGLPLFNAMALLSIIPCLPGIS